MSSTVQPLPQVALPSRKQVAVGAVVAVAITGIALVFFVLPAERGIDLTGFGEATGLTGLAQSGAAENIYLKRGQARTNVLFPLASPIAAEALEADLRSGLETNGQRLLPGVPIRTDHFTWDLLPYEGIELKYTLAQGAPMIFAWSAPKVLNIDMHSHPFDGGDKLTESFVIAPMQQQSAIYVAPFAGIHGWYWQNRSLDNVMLTLDAAGQFTASQIFNQAGPHPRPLTDEQPAGAPAAAAATE
ncbi:MAG: hypothetical protein ABIT16_01360 [Croceibacterium sp.]